MFFVDYDGEMIKYDALLAVAAVAEKVKCDIPDENWSTAHALHWPFDVYDDSKTGLSAEE